MTPSHVHDLLCKGHGTKLEMPFHAAQEDFCSPALNTSSTAGPCAAQGWSRMPCVVRGTCICRKYQ